MKHPWIEAGKNLLIVVLMLLAVLQTLYIISPGPFSELPGIRRLFEALDPKSGVTALPVQEAQVQEAVRPTALSIKTENGRTSWQNSFQATDSAYESLGRWLGEALGTAGTIEEISDQDWLDALAATGICYHFPGQVPVSALAQWLGADWSQGSTGRTAQDYVVCILEDAVVLCFRDEGACWSAACLVSASALTQALEDYGGDGSLFAFEGVETYPQLEQTASAALITLSGLTVSQVQVQTDFSIEELAVTLGFNPYAETGYTASDGSRVFTDSGKRLRISGTQISCTGTDLAHAADSSDSALTESARCLLENLTESVRGDARLVITDFDRSGDTATLTFSYLVDGIRVALSRQEAARLTFSGTSLISLELAVRRFCVTDQTELVMSAMQAAALLEPGQGLELVYGETGSDWLQCGWQAVTLQSADQREGG